MQEGVCQDGVRGVRGGQDRVSRGCKGRKGSWGGVLEQKVRASYPGIQGVVRVSAT